MILLVHFALWTLFIDQELHLSYYRIGRKREILVSRFLWGNRYNSKYFHYKLIFYKIVYSLQENCEKLFETREFVESGEKSLGPGWSICVKLDLFTKITKLIKVIKWYPAWKIFLKLCSLLFFLWFMSNCPIVSGRLDQVKLKSGRRQ